MSPPDFPRRATLPPAPPPTGLEPRVWMLERDLGEIKDTLHNAKLSLDDIKNTLIVIQTERSAEDKSRERLMKIITGIAVSVSVTALGTMAAWVIHVQSAMAAVGK